MPLSPVTRIPLSLEVSRRLREAIIDGTFGANEELPTEAELSQLFGVGRSTVREALRVLQSQGLLSGSDSVSPTRPRVTHHLTTGTAAAALQTAMQVGAVPLDDLVALRVLLESDTMHQVAAVPTDARGCLATMATAASVGDVENFHLADVEFHVRLAYAGGNKAIGLVLEALRDSIAAHLLAALRQIDAPTATLTQLCGEHEAIVAALDAGEGERAGALMIDHIRGFYEGSRA